MTRPVLLLDRRIIDPAQMSEAILLTLGFSPVMTTRKCPNRFNGFPRAGKPLKRLDSASPLATTRLKPGVIERRGLAAHCNKPQ